MRPLALQIAHLVDAGLQAREARIAALEDDLKPYALELGAQLRRVAALTAALREARQWIETGCDHFENSEAVVRYLDRVLDGHE